MGLDSKMDTCKKEDSGEDGGHEPRNHDTRVAGRVDPEHRRRGVLVVDTGGRVHGGRRVPQTHLWILPGRGARSATLGPKDGRESRGTRGDLGTTWGRTRGGDPESGEDGLPTPFPPTCPSPTGGNLPQIHRFPIRRVTFPSARRAHHRGRPPGRGVAGKARESTSKTSSSHPCPARALPEKTG